jgi:hypothetical protein
VAHPQWTPFLQTLATRHARTPASSPRIPHPRPLRKTASLVLAAACAILSASGGFASTWPDAKVQAVTQYMQQFRSDWTVQDTIKKSQGKIPHSEASAFIGKEPANLKLEADGGRLIPISVMGESILIRRQRHLRQPGLQDQAEHTVPSSMTSPAVKSPPATVAPSRTSPTSPSVSRSPFP